MKFSRELVCPRAFQAKTNDCLKHRTLSSLCHKPHRIIYACHCIETIGVTQTSKRKLVSNIPSKTICQNGAFDVTEQITSLPNYSNEKMWFVNDACYFDATNYRRPNETLVNQLSLRWDSTTTTTADDLWFFKDFFKAANVR